MAKPLTKIRSNMNLKAAAAMREAELAAHAAHYAEACRQTNAAFGVIIDRESKKTPMVRLVESAGLSRQNLIRLRDLSRDTPASV